MNSLFRNIFFIFVLLFLLIDTLFLFSDPILGTEIYAIVQLSREYFPIITILEIIFLSLLAYTTSIKPIRNLQKEIAFFITGSKQ